MGYAQENAQIIWDTVDFHTVHSFSTINSENGLLQNEVKDLYFAPNSGVLWMATQQGLVRYSGRKLEVLTPKKVGFLSSPRIRDFYVFQDSAVIVYDDENLYCEIASDGLHLRQSNVIREDFLFCDNGVLVNRKNASSKFQFYYLSASETEAYTLVLKGDVHQFVYIKGHKETVITEKLDYYFADHSFLFEGSVYGFSKEGYFLRIKGARLDTLDYIPQFSIGQAADNEVQLIYKGFYSTAYLVYKGALLRFSVNRLGAPVFSQIAAGLPAYEYSSCQELVDENRVFLGTRRRGLLSLRPRYVTQLYNDDFCSKPYGNYALAEIGEDSVITADGLLFSNNRIDCSHRFNQAEFWYPLAFHEGQRTLYTARSRFQIGKFNIDTWDYSSDTIDFESGSRYLGPMTVYKDSVYLFVEHYGLCVYRADSWELILPKYEGASKPRQLCFQNDSLVWLSTRYGITGLNLASGKTICDFRVPDGIVGGRAVNIVQGRVWFSVYGGGVWVQSGDTWLKFAPAQYDQLEAVHAIIPKGDKVHFSTNSGLLSFEIEDVLKYCVGELDIIQAFSLSKQDGLVQQEFNGGCQPAHLWLTDGRLVLPGLLGLTYIEADFEKYRSKLRSKMDVVSVEFNNKDTVFLNGFELPSFYESFKLNLVNAYYGEGSNAQVYYRIPEIGETWQVLDFDKGILVSRLPSNEDYTIEILIPGLGLEKRKQELFKFSVAPRFYEKPIFILFLVVSSALLFVVILVLVQKKNKRQKERLNTIISERTADLARNNIRLKQAVDELEDSKILLNRDLEMRNKMITVFSHDIRGPLRFLADIASNLAEGASNKDVKSIEKELQILANGASGAYSTANNVLEWIRNSMPGQEKVEVSLIDAVNRVLGQKQALFDRHQIEIVKTLDQDVIAISNKRVFDIVVENLVQNALKYCRSRIEVCIEKCADNQVCLKIIDDGMGILSPKLLSDLNAGYFVKSTTGNRGGLGSGVGLAMVHELLQQMGGAQLSFKNVKQGFMVTVSFGPDPNTY